MIPLVFLFLLIVCVAMLLRVALPRLRIEPESLENKINRLLPQTQCGLCGYNGCKPYARAIARGTADINRCPPGGEGGIEKLARLMKVNAKPLNSNCGTIKTRTVAFINEAHCIGCTLCIQACPVDAIIGAAKQMHTILRRDCTGCELCIPPCPVDCIDMRALAAGI